MIRRSIPTPARLRAEEVLARRRRRDATGRGIDPYAVSWVPPAEIVRISGRPRPRTGGNTACGRIEAGEWDRVPPRAGEDTIARLVCAEQFDDTTHHRSLVDHFLHRVPWAETDFIKALESLGGDAHWPAYASPEAIRSTCARLDALFARVADRGLVSQRQLAIETRSSESFLSLMRNEILVDVARTGELLFYEGRHRLSIAKILNLALIPVAFTTWHAEHPRVASASLGQSRRRMSRLSLKLGE